MDHGGSGDVDVLAPDEHALRVHHVVAQERGPEDVVAEEDQVAGVRIDLGVGRHR